MSTAERANARLIDAEELGRLLGIEPDTARLWGRQGRIPRVKLGKNTVRFDFAAVLAAMESGGQGPDA